MTADAATNAIVNLRLAPPCLEDIVAVVMLAILGSYIAIDVSGSGRSPLLVIGMVAGFAVLVFIIGTLLLPLLFRLRGIANHSESISIMVGGLAMGSGLMAVYAGFSLALGAFLCGVVIAGTSQKQLVERSFHGLKDIFLTVFFVTIGMMVDISLFPQVWHWILLGTMGALFGRTLAATVALMLIGEHPRTALQAGLLLSPIGEFSFIVAGIAIAGGIVPAEFQAVVVGTVLCTSLLAPLLGGKSDALTHLLAKGRWPALDKLHAEYSQFWSFPIAPSQRKGLWGILRKRALQVGIEALLISTVLIFAADLIAYFAPRLPTALAPARSELVLWSAVGLLALVPLIALWRNLSACAMIIAENIAANRGLQRMYQLLIEHGLKALFAAVTAIWLLNVMPAGLPRWPTIAVVMLLFIPAVALLWRRAVRLHSGIEWTLQRRLSESSGNRQRQLFDNWKEGAWGLNLREFVLPDSSELAGRTLRELNLRGATNCSVVGIHRHGFDITDVRPETALFPGDELLLLGSDHDVDTAVRFLTSDAMTRNSHAPLSEQILKSITVNGPCAALDRSLGELRWSQRFGVQALAVMRDGRTQVTPSATLKIVEKDRLLLLGTHSRIQELAEADL